MNVTFHVLAAAGIAHVAGPHLRPRDGGALLSRADGPALAAVAGLALLSHGVLDGLKHGYPLGVVPDIALAGALATGWCLAVRRRFAALFATAFLAALMPDIIDLAPAMLRSATGMPTPAAAAAHLFPWHWPDGSGSMYPPAPGRLAAGTRVLDAGDNLIVSWTNHLIVVALATAGICTNLAVFGFVANQRSAGAERSDDLGFPRSRRNTRE